MPRYQGKLVLLKSQVPPVEDTFEVQATTTRPTITATDGEGVVSHAGSRLLADVADRTTLTGQLAVELAGLRRLRARHDPGRVLVDMAVAVADGATTISDVAVLADQAALFGAVASDSTCWRLLDQFDTVQLGAVARARAAAREVVWARRAELTGEPFPPARAAAPPTGVVSSQIASDRPSRSSLKLDRGPLMLLPARPRRTIAEPRFPRGRPESVDVRGALWAATAATTGPRRSQAARPTRPARCT